MNGQIHHIPGRLRLRLPQLKRQAALGANLNAALIAVDGILSATVNTVSGGLLILYDAAAAISQDFWDELRTVLAAFGLASAQPSARGLPQVPGPRSDAGTRLLDVLAEKALERGAFALLAALI